MTSVMFGMATRTFIGIETPQAPGVFEGSTGS
jgi:hypothetical protein